MKEFVSKLRKEQTGSERRLRSSLRNRELSGFNFRRQHEIGPYIVDFCCPQKRLIIELDGGQHAEQALKDQERTIYLNHMGYRVLRFWDHEVLQELDSVLEAIRLTLLEGPHPNPLPEREREKLPIA